MYYPCNTFPISNVIIDLNSILCKHIFLLIRSYLRVLFFIFFFILNKIKKNNNSNFTQSIFHNKNKFYHQT